jgi:mRNA-degrading endonuclease YafQ of YafQ-DinJ toxin-antitoxin module
MRILEQTKKFDKEFAKLNKVQQTKSLIAIKKFQTGKYDKQLKVHKLNGNLANNYAFSIDRKLRIIYSVVNDTVELCLLEHVGTHGQVYR